MKNFLAFTLLLGFSVAVCYAVPSDYGSFKHTSELSKKYFEMQACELPAAVVEVPAAPVVVYDLVVRTRANEVKLVIPQTNSPPRKRISLKSYSMAFKLTSK